jgi:hypothetical protein
MRPCVFFVRWRTVTAGRLVSPFLRPRLCMNGTEGNSESRQGGEYKVPAVDHTDSWRFSLRQVVKSGRDIQSRKRHHVP